tara:strand:- start:313 stop:876 length:564 start_codon:yes stop_codon:yes gene_type:complete
MINQNIIIYKFDILFNILNEIKEDLDFEIIKVSKEENLKDITDRSKNYLIISKKKIETNENQIILNSLPIKIMGLIEKLNVEFLKQQFSNQSRIEIKDYLIDLNSREIIKNKLKLKLTEKEVNTVVYLFNSKKSISIDELQKNVWGYISDIETHTVETHIYRLRKKILKIFDDQNFIISEKNGYKIK